MKSPIHRNKAAASHVLVVEDEEKSRRLMRDLLVAHGYQVSEAIDGEDALMQVAKQFPDCILLDVMMPRMDGFEVCRRLQADKRTVPIPVILVTALHDREDRIKGIAAGATDFITKPVDTPEMLLRVRNALRTKKLFDQRTALLRMREELSDMIVHDLRNPLLAITLCADGLGKRCTPSEVAHLAEAILGQTQLLDCFVNDLLAVSKMEQGHLTLHRAREDLVELGRASFHNLRVLAANKGIRLVLAAPDGACFAEVDKALFARLLDNLIANAVKFASDNSCVTLTFTPASDAGMPIRFTVEDEGPGIPLSYRETIFEKYGVVKMKNRDMPQIGLGLTFCRMAVEAHGGRITVDARQPHGSVFMIELP